MKLIVFPFLLMFSCFAHCQTSEKQSLEFSFQLRREKQADYTTRFGTVSYQNSLQLHGTSIGFDIGYKKFWKNTWFIKPGIGYYKFGVQKIINSRIPARPFDPIENRIIDYNDDSTLLLYSTNQYAYNNFSLGITLGKYFTLSKDWNLTSEVSFTNLFTFSQRYNVFKKVYKTKNNKNLGYLIDYKIGVAKELTHFYLSSNIIIPVYKKWKKDIVFLENPDDKLESWFNGYGLLITIGKYL